MSHWTDEAWNAAHAPDAVLFREVTTQKAAIEHTCAICNGTIVPGVHYVREVFMIKGDETPTVNKQHVAFWDCEGP